MAIYNLNTDFYKDVNDLVTLATGGTITGIVDYNSFIDAGRSIGEFVDTDEFRNAFASALANKVQLSISTARTYRGRYGFLVRGKVPANGIIEVITHGWLNALDPKFAELTDGQSVDMYEIMKPIQNANYYLKSNPLQYAVTIQDYEIAGAFKSPEAMARFLTDKITYLFNSYELGREVARSGLMCDQITDIDEHGTVATTMYDAATKYPLLTLYNALTGASLTSSNALVNEQFIRFAAMMIRTVSGKLGSPSTRFNLAGERTFTRNDGEKETIVASHFVAAMAAYIRPYPGDTSIAVIEDGYEEVPFWQDENNPLIINYVDDNEEEATTAPVIAMINDVYTLGEWIERETSPVTPYNAGGEYYNQFINGQFKYTRNRAANSVIFTLE